VRNRSIVALVVVVGTGLATLSCGGGHNPVPATYQDPKLVRVLQSGVHWSDGTYVPVNGHRLFAVCRGHGAPTVVLESGLSADSATWQKVFGRVASFTSVCAYDRAGLGRSEPGPIPATYDSAVSDLRDLLTGLQVGGPVVIAGSSAGGDIALAFAEAHPEVTAGIILIDAPPFDFTDHANAALPGVLNVPCHNREHFEFCGDDALYALRTQPGALGSRPLEILTSTDHGWPSSYTLQQQRTLDDLQIELQRNERSLSSRSGWTLVHTKHVMEWFAPDAVVRKIGHVVNQASA
jgi:pimeloyl-ACP methyl ester carboxylesterase